MLTKAMTFVELLVAVSVIVLLTALMYPALAAAKESANEVACQSNLRQLALAVELYRAEYDPTGHYGEDMGLPPNPAAVSPAWKELHRCRGQARYRPNPAYVVTFHSNHPLWVKHVVRMENRAVLWIDGNHRNQGRPPSAFSLSYAFAVQLDTSIRRQRKRGAWDTLDFWEDKSD